MLQSLATPAASSTSSDVGAIGAFSELESVLGLTDIHLVWDRRALRRWLRADSGLPLSPRVFGRVFGDSTRSSPLMANAETAATTPVAAVGDGGAADGAAGAAMEPGAAPTELARGGVGVRWGLRSLGQPGRRAFVGGVVGAAELALGGGASEEMPAGVPLAAPRRRPWRAGWVSHSHSAGYRGPQLWPPPPARAVPLLLSKYGSRLKVVARPPAAGYPAEPAAPQPRDIRCPRPRYPTNGHAPPGYRPAIVYLPTNGHEPANV